MSQANSNSNESAFAGYAKRRRRNFTLALLTIGVLATLTVLHLRYISALDSRLLMAVPDSIPSDAELMNYAKPRGESTYLKHCAKCHGVSLRGDPSKGIPNLVDADWLYGSGRIGEIERIILYGIRSGHPKTQKLADMPAFATANPYARYHIEPLNPREVDDVAALVYSFQHPSSVDAATVARGKAIYAGKGLCFDCHSEHAKGDSAIGAPNLTDSIWLYGDGTPESIKAEISRGLAGVCPSWESRLGRQTIRAAAVFVYSRRKPH
jgi:cytochrome c oxidase cbb3-type subunit 3